MRETEKIMHSPRLAGLSIRLTDGTMVKFGGPPPDAGIREPRKPRPVPPSASQRVSHR